MQSNRKRGLRPLILALDAGLLLCAWLLAIGLHEWLRPVLYFLREPPSFDQYAVLPFLVLPMFLAMIAFFGLHRTFERVWSAGQLIFDLAKLHLTVFLGLAVLVFLTRAVINRTLLLGFLGSSFLLLYAERRVLGRWRRYQHETGRGRQRVLLIGSRSPELSSFVTAAKIHPLPPYFVGLVAPAEDEGPTTEGIPRVGGLSDVDRLIHDEAVSQVLFFPPFHTPELDSPSLQTLELLGIPASFAVPLPRLFGVPARMLSIYDLPFVSFETAPKRSESLALKQAVDFVLAAVVLLLASPLMLFAALTVWVTMGRPIFFVQERAGLFGRRFRMAKFRTMVLDAEKHQSDLTALNEMSGPVFKLSADPRITAVGSLLRRTSIDELPQLFHVLQGSMSLVGPRPLPIREQQNIHGWHRRRLSMKPGITGLWQVRGRNDVDFEEWMRLDLAYVDHWTLMLDSSILLKTVPAVLRGHGAR